MALMGGLADGTRPRSVSSWDSRSCAIRVYSHRHSPFGSILQAPAHAHLHRGGVVRQQSHLPLQACYLVSALIVGAAQEVLAQLKVQHARVLEGKGRGW